MNIQEIALSNSQKKKIQRDVNSEEVLQIDDNGDLIVHVASYVEFRKTIKGRDMTPIEVAVGEGILDFDVEYFVFS
jgi:hypothetical protein